MRFIGPERRAADLRRAANRLRWEIDYALDNGRHGGHDETGVSNALGDIAEALGILRQIAGALDARFPPGHPERASFAHLSQFYAGYHHTPR